MVSVISGKSETKWSYGQQMTSHEFLMSLLTNTTKVSIILGVCHFGKVKYNNNNCNIKLLSIKFLCKLFSLRNWKTGVIITHNSLDSASHIIQSINMW